VYDQETQKRSRPNKGCGPNNNNNNNNSSIQCFIIYVPSQQLQGQLQTQHSVGTRIIRIRIMGKDKQCSNGNNNNNRPKQSTDLIIIIIIINNKPSQAPSNLTVLNYY
jgi:hypothetical protein